MELVKASDYGLEETKVKGIEEAFAPKIAEREELNKFYIGIIKEELTPELSKKAGDLRRKLVKVRTGISDIHKTQKSFFLASGKFVDAWKNKETAPVIQMEEKLSEIEKYAENLEKERLEELQEKRIELIKDYIEDAEERDFSSMENDVWEAYFETKKTAFHDLISAKNKAAEEKAAEEKAEKERQVAIEKENVKLRAEAEAKEKQLKKDRLERERIELERVTKERKESEAIELKQEKERKIIADKLLKEQKEKEAIEKELQDKKDAEAKAEKDRLALIEKNRLEEVEKEKAPVKEKIDIWINSLSLGKPPLLNDTIIDIELKFEDFKKWAKKEAKNM
jgi:hypothetical protein